MDIPDTAVCTEGRRVTPPHARDVSDNDTQVRLISSKAIGARSDTLGTED